MLPRNSHLIQVYIISLLGGCQLAGNSHTHGESAESEVASMNRVIKSASFGAIELELLYRSPESLAFQALGQEGSEEALDQMMAEFSGSVCFLFIMSHMANLDLLKGLSSDRSDYEQLTEYVAFQMQGDLWIVQSSDTIPCSAYHWERDYGLTGSIRVVCAFESVSTEQDFTFIYDDALFGVGQVKFNFLKEDFRNLPKPKIPRS